MADKKSVKKITRGWNLSQENVMWLRQRAFEETVARPSGTVSGSDVLDRIVTEAREKEAREERILAKVKEDVKKVKG